MIIALADRLVEPEVGHFREINDVCIVGGGPAGLAIAVRAASAGLAVLVVEAKALGGQAVQRREREDDDDVPAVPTETDPHIDVRRRAHPAAAAIGRVAVGLSVLGALRGVQLPGDGIVLARTVVVATGASYRRLNLASERNYDGSSLHYVATGREAALCIDEEVLIVGGGCTACQAAVFLGGVARHVHMIVRGEGLRRDVSGYLAERIRQSPHVTLHLFTEILDLSGAGTLDRVTLRSTLTRTCTTLKVRHVFVLIGGTANTGWLNGQLVLDANGFIRTGAITRGALSRFQTSCAGVFAVGDVRAQPVKTVSAAVGEGFAVVTDLKRYLEALGV